MSTAGEKAMALVDGQLSPAEVPDLVQELARNSALVTELQAYLALSRSRISEPYMAKADEPVPDRLIEAVMGRPAQPAPRDARKSSREAWRGGAGSDLLGWLRRSYRVPAWSLAALPVLAAVTAFASALTVLPLRDDRLQTDLAVALERTASGKDAALATLRPMLSFAAKDAAGWCRQFEIRGASRQVSHALACRSGSGDWTVVASTAPAAAGYVPAGANRRQVIDDLATSMMRGEPLSEADEAAAISSGWRPKL